jgi:hypothetical protein
MIGFVNDDLCKDPRPCFISRIPDTSSHVVSSNDRQIINLNRETILAEGVLRLKKQDEDNRLISFIKILSQGAA